MPSNEEIKPIVVSKKPVKFAPGLLKREKSTPRKSAIIKVKKVVTAKNTKLPINEKSKYSDVLVGSEPFKS